MHYVYLLRSESHPQEAYIGLTRDLKARLHKHNEGSSPHTAKFRPWNLVTYLAFSTRQQASDFEIYPKSGSGRAFASKRLWLPRKHLRQHFGQCAVQFGFVVIVRSKVAESKNFFKTAATKAP